MLSTHGKDSTYIIATDPQDPPKITIYNPLDPQDRKQLESKQQFTFILDDNLIPNQDPPFIIFKNDNEIYGFGIVAVKEFKLNELVCNYKGEIADDCNTDDIYGFGLKKDKEFFTAMKMGSAGRYINHNSFYENIRVYEDGHKLDCHSIKKILPDQQLLFNYGKKYWNALEITPQYISPYQNHLGRAAFLQKYKNNYDFKNIKPLTDEIKKYFQLDTKTTATHMVLPKLSEINANNVE
ncbi:MAG: SET domain-containing protein, partial [Gammaproteobacteria bacterium]|nr:SET domain-containing protein [Gammaproteobacteria bacterium]